MQLKIKMAVNMSQRVIIMADKDSRSPISKFKIMPKMQIKINWLLRNCDKNYRLRKDLSQIDNESVLS